MKKLLLVLFSVMILVACGTDKEVTNDDKEGNKETQAESSQINEVIEDTEEPKETNEGSSESGLLEVGQVRKDSVANTSVELIAIKEINEKIDLDPMMLIIKDIKILKFFDVGDEFVIDEIESILGERRETFYTIQIQFSMENTVKSNIEFRDPIKNLVLNTGEQIDVIYNDLALDKDYGGTFYGKVKKDSLISVLIDDSNVDEIETIKIITGYVFDEEYNTIHSDIERTYEID